ncbi:unnamed protein product [marine sediment metagenome]|uniref:Uncharacterized protein n=1 Tax=marine sediment metagenome TaxID=412755 RepID=X1EXC7_9ZZZZ
MRIENLIFLGAGASHSEGASIQANLLNDFFITHDDINDIKKKEIKKSIQNLLKDFFGFEFRLNEQVNKKPPTFEEILGILDLAIQKNEGFRNYENVSKIREDFISLIALTIIEKLNVFPSPPVRLHLF